MSFFSGRKQETTQQRYTPVGQNETDKMLPADHSSANGSSLGELAALRRSQRSLKRALWIVTILAVCLVALLLGSMTRASRKSLLIPQILKSPVPPIPLRTYTFERNALFASPPSEETDRAWDDLLPIGRGFVFIPEHEKYDLPPGEETGYDADIYSVALFHQLHCLGVLRKTYWKLVNGVRDDRIEWLHKLVGNLLGPDGEHIHHCFDYLRQTIQCAGDMSIEWAREAPEGVQRKAVDGWGIPHECKNWDHIVDYMRDNYFNASTNNQIAPEHHGHNKRASGLLDDGLAS